MASEKGSKKEVTISWWQLSLFGIGSIIGTGFFLGSSIGIEKGGPAVLLAFLLAAYATYVVFHALATMTAKHPMKGSFRSYAKKAYGRWAGFGVGWVYWSAEMLIMGSQLIALSIFTRMWFPTVPIWILASIYAVLGILVLIIGTKALNRVENLFAIIKVAAIVMFILLAGLALFGIFNEKIDPNIPSTPGEFFPNGIIGLWSSLIFAFYAFGGIEVMGLMASQLKKPKDAPKSGKIMLILLSGVYLTSIGLALVLLPWRDFDADHSPFVLALNQLELAFIPHMFNGAFIIAGFSTMVAALYGVTTILVTLASDGDAPRLFAKEGKLAVPFPALCLTSSGLIFSVVMALVMPDQLFEYIATGAGLMLLYNWFVILLSAQKIVKTSFFVKFQYKLGMLLILLGVTGTLFSKTSRPGFFISLAFLITIAIVTFIVNKKKNSQSDSSDTSLFKQENPKLKKLETLFQKK